MVLTLKPRLLFLSLVFTAGCSGTVEPLDAGEDFGADSGLTDSGVSDFGAADAESMDFADSGADAAADSGADDASDFGVDSGADAGSDSGCAAWPTSDLIQHSSGELTVTVTELTDCLRSADLNTTAVLRQPNRPSLRTVTELATQSILRSGRPALDAVFALAHEERRQLQTAALTDGAFNGGQPVPCRGGCFQTGELWGWAWTRDTGYAAHLGLALTEPDRSKNTLEFLLSNAVVGRRLFIVQDTGTGGSWPASSDRVVWALGGRATWLALSGPDRKNFEAAAFAALRNTLEQDRLVIFDAEAGLYRGESSFLDWREQSYPSWVRQDPARIAESFSLSTNLAHLAAIEWAAEIATNQGESPLQYQNWATALRSQLALTFMPTMSASVPGGFDRAPVARQDLLASSLAILANVGTATQQSQALADYPVLPGGIAVLWPQSPSVPIYHNRGSWPFVTTYALLAARRVNNAELFHRLLSDLNRQAGLHLSHMENYEAVSGRAFVEDGPFSGPVVNSERQLWSVAGFLGAIQHGLFGIELTPEGLTVNPYLPASTRRWLGGERVELQNLRVGDATLQINLHLPADEPGVGVFPIDSITFDGATAAGDFVWMRDLWQGSHTIDIHFGALQSQPDQLRTLSGANNENVFAPNEPDTLRVTDEAGAIRLTWNHAGGAVFDVVRNGQVVAQSVAANTWLDASPPGGSPCYAVQARFTSSGNTSHRTPAACFWGTNFERINPIFAADFANVGGQGITQYGRFHYQGWGDEGHSLAASYTATANGQHSFQLVYGNGAGPHDTGIGCAVKRLRVLDPTSQVVAEGYAVMPQLGTWDAWRDSTYVDANLVAGTTYRIVIDGDDQSRNMSFLDRFQNYTNAPNPLPFSRVNIAELKILRR